MNIEHATRLMGWLRDVLCLKHSNIDVTSFQGEGLNFYSEGDLLAILSLRWNADAIVVKISDARKPDRYEEFLFSIDAFHDRQIILDSFQWRTITILEGAKDVGT